jgi:molecular chaperone GrpE
LERENVTAKDHKKGGSTSSLKQAFDSDEVSDATDAINKEADLLEYPSHAELDTKLTEAEKKANEYYDRMLRMQAETDNMQRRVERDIANAHKYALEKFANDLLPIIDSFERAASLTDTHESKMIEGVQLTLKMLYTVLEKYGIQQLDPLSQPFNPELHQAVSTQVDSTVQPGTVLNVLQKGYTLNNRLIRPALVVVSKAG